MEKLKIDDVNLQGIADTIKRLNTRIATYEKKYGTDTEQYQTFINALQISGVKLSKSSSGHTKIAPKTQQNFNNRNVNILRSASESGRLTIGKQAEELRNVIDKLGNQIDVEYKVVEQTETGQRQEIYKRVKSEDLESEPRKALKLMLDFHNFMLSLPEEIYNDENLKETARQGTFPSWQECFKFMADVQDYMQKIEEALWS